MRLDRSERRKRPMAVSKRKPLRRVTVTLDPDDYAVVEKMAKSSDVSASWLIRRSMREFLERHDPVGKIEIAPNKNSTA